jgi:hypothetical protein
MPLAKPLRIAASILLFTVSLCAAPHPRPLRWSPAHFRGLALGRAQRAEAIHVLGPPDAVTRGHSGEELIYKGRGDHKGELFVRLDRRGIVFEIQESFPVAIPRSRIYKELGQDAQSAHYSQARCAGNILYRDPGGPLELTLYPERGIVVWPDQYGYDFAAILYRAQPPGASRPPACAVRR